MRELELRKGIVLKLAASAWLVVNCALLALWLVTPLFGRGKSRQAQQTA
jgi:hypothetical protein